MVALGSGGAIRDADFILNRLPLAQGQTYEQIFWALRRVETADIFTGGSSGGMNQTI